MREENIRKRMRRKKTFCVQKNNEHGWYYEFEITIKAYVKFLGQFACSELGCQFWLIWMNELQETLSFYSGTLDWVSFSVVWLTCAGQRCSDLSLVASFLASFSWRASAVERSTLDCICLSALMKLQVAVKSNVIRSCHKVSSVRNWRSSLNPSLSTAILWFCSVRQSLEFCNAVHMGYALIVFSILLPGGIHMLQGWFHFLTCDVIPLTLLV